MRKKSLQQVDELLDRQRTLLAEQLSVHPAIVDGPLSEKAEPRHSASDAQPSEAFDALRRTVESVRGERHVHQAHLALVHRALLRAGGPKGPLLLTSDLLRRVGVRVEHDLTKRDLFTDHEGLESVDGGQLYELVDPAYVDETSGRVVQQGVIARSVEVSA